MLAFFTKSVPSHLDRYVAECAGGHNIRLLDILGMMLSMVAGMVGKRLPYRVSGGFGTILGKPPMAHGLGVAMDVPVRYSVGLHSDRLIQFASSIGYLNP